MAKFKTRFWELLSQKERAEGKRYNNMSEVAGLIGVSRMTLYKYADETMGAVDARTVGAFMEFFGLAGEDVDHFLILGEPAPAAQDGHAKDRAVFSTPSV